MVLDDGTGLVELGLSSDFSLRQWKSGMYMMVVGVYHIRTGDIPLLKVIFLHLPSSYDNNMQLLGL